MQQIFNFVGTRPIEVVGWIFERTTPLVSIRQDGGSMSFQHAMTPDQAVELANALIDAAKNLQPVLTQEVAHVE